MEYLDIQRIEADGKEFFALLTKEVPIMLVERVYADKHYFGYAFTYKAGEQTNKLYVMRSLVEAMRDRLEIINKCMVNARFGKLSFDSVKLQMKAGYSLTQVPIVYCSLTGKSQKGNRSLVKKQQRALEKERKIYENPNGKSGRIIKSR